MNFRGPLQAWVLSFVYLFTPINDHIIRFVILLIVCRGSSSNMSGCFYSWLQNNWPVAMTADLQLFVCALMEHHESLTKQQPAAGAVVLSLFTFLIIAFQTKKLLKSNHHQNWPIILQSAVGAWKEIECPNKVVESQNMNFHWVSIMQGGFP